MKLASALRRVRGRRTGTLFAPAGASKDGRRILFIRDLISFHGGHIKAHDYFEHVLAAEGFVPYIWFTSRSVFDDRNPWSASELERCDDWVRPDFFFVGGGDWVHVDALGGGPVINLIQHVRHANEGSDRYRLLSRPALRICVSPEVADAIGATGRVNGPVVTISNGIDVAEVERSASTERSMDLLVVANKQPDLGRRLAQDLDAGRLVDSVVPRRELLDAMGGARVTLFVPNPTEGFYLPALEGMAIGTIVVCPDVVGNRSFCVPGETAFRPDYDADAMAEAARRALAAPSGEMLAAARRMAQAHDIARERSEFLDVLRRIDELVPSSA